MKKLQKIFHNEDGQALVIFALLLVVLLGVVALVIDVGMMRNTKIEMQTAADAAALAGAQDFPDKVTAKGTAEDYGSKNGAESTIADPDYGVDKIEVYCTKKWQYTFAKVFGLTDPNISARAVAEKFPWAYEALPFINLDGLAENSTKGEALDAWNDVYPGDKERIHNNDLIIGTNSIKVKLDDGLILYKKGQDMSNIKDPLMNIVVVGNTVYLISVKNSEMENYAKGGSKELKEGDKVPCTDTVLLECEVTDGFNGTGKDVISLKFVTSYNWDESTKTYLSAEGLPPKGTVKLVE